MVSWPNAAVAAKTNEANRTNTRMFPSRVNVYNSRRHLVISARRRLLLHSLETRISAWIVARSETSKAERRRSD
jgi:hypothetical protein